MTQFCTLAKMKIVLVYLRVLIYSNLTLIYIGNDHVMGFMASGIDILPSTWVLLNRHHKRNNRNSLEPILDRHFRYLFR